MKAIVYRTYGSPSDILKCEEVERPTPKDDEVLIRVRAAGVNPLDWRLMRGKPYTARLFFGLRGPRMRMTRPGRDVAGVVEEIGRGVTRFKPGDEVFGACPGAFAEYACARERGLVPKPAGVTFEQAASLPVAGLSALQGLRDRGQIRPGQKVLVNGAAGGVGTFAVQIAKTFGAEVTGVCSTRNLELVRSIGADTAVDYTREDFTKGARRYDIILDCVGNLPPSASRRALTPEGVCVIVGAPYVRWTLGLLSHIFKPLLLSPFVSQRFAILFAKLRVEDLTLLGELVESGKVKPVIDRRYGLCETPAALGHAEGGHARGKILITLPPPPEGV